MESSHRRIPKDQLRGKNYKKNNNKHLLPLNSFWAKSSLSKTRIMIKQCKKPSDPLGFLHNAIEELNSGLSRTNSGRTGRRIWTRDLQISNPTPEKTLFPELHYFLFWYLFVFFISPRDDMNTISFTKRVVQKEVERGKKIIN